MLQEAGWEDIPSGPSAWCCTLDADIPLLLTVEEEEQYLERSLKAAANSCADLAPCPQPNCDGVAVAGQGEAVGRLACSEVPLCRAVLLLVQSSCPQQAHAGFSDTLKRSSSSRPCIQHYVSDGGVLPKPEAGTVSTEQACDLWECMTAEDDSPALVCNACKHVWCGKCNVAWHSNRSCDDYQRVCGEKEADKGMEEYKKSNRMIKCPTCGHGIEKISGCNRVQ